MVETQNRFGVDTAAKVFFVTYFLRTTVVCCRDSSNRRPEFVASCPPGWLAYLHMLQSFACFPTNRAETARVFRWFPRSVQNIPSNPMLLLLLPLRWVALNTLLSRLLFVDCCVDSAFADYFVFDTIFGAAVFRIGFCR